MGSFLAVNKDRVKNNGHVFVAKVDRDKVVVGRCKGSDKLSAILVVAADWADKGKLPSVSIVKFKKVRNMVEAEARLHSYLADFLVPSGRFYEISDKVLAEYWKEV